VKILNCAVLVAALLSLQVSVCAQLPVTEYQLLDFKQKAKPASQGSAKAAYDACASATTLVVDAGCTNGSTNSHSLQGGESTDCVTAGGGINLETSWYRFNTGTETTLNMSWLYTNTVNCFPGIVVWGPFTPGAGCLPSGVSAFCLNIQNGDPGYHTQLAGLTTNSDYLIQVIGRNCGGGNDRFIDYCLGVYSVPTNNTSSGGSLIDQCGLTFNGTNAGYTITGTGVGFANLDNNAATTCPTCATGSDVTYAINNDSWFYFCAVNAGTWNVNFTNISNCVLNTGLQMTIFTGNPTALTFVESAPSPSAPGSNFTSANFAVGAGTCVYMVVDGFAGDQCDYSYSLTNVSGGCVILPVGFLSFDAHIDKNRVLLEWKVGSETTSDYYTVQRSTDGIEFESIYRLQASEQGTVNNYHYVDDGAPAGQLYYRIVQTDFDGLFAYSDVVAVQLVKNQELRLVPNPAQDLVQLFYETSHSESGLLHIKTTTGQTVKTISVNSQEGQNSIDLDVEDLKRGVYIVELVLSNRVSAVRLVLTD